MSQKLFDETLEECKARCPVEMSQIIVTSVVGTGTSLKDKDELESINCCNSASPFCAFAISVKSMGGCTEMAFGVI